MFTGGNLDRAKNRGVIYTVAPSFRNVNTIWTGSTMIHSADPRRRKTWTTSAARAHSVEQGVAHGGIAFRR